MSWHDLIVILDDATNPDIYYALQLAPEESTFYGDGRATGSD